VEIGNYTEHSVISAVYFEGEKGWTMVKRFKIETSTMDQKFIFLPETSGTKLYFASLKMNPLIKYSFNVGKTKEEKEVLLEEFIDVKGWKALGNKLVDTKLTKVEMLSAQEEVVEDIVVNSSVDADSDTEAVKPTPIDLKLPSEISKPEATDKKDEDSKPKLKPGDTIEFDF
jgi:topoisomerase IV subunit A